MSVVSMTSVKTLSLAFLVAVVATFASVMLQIQWLFFVSWICVMLIFLTLSLIFVSTAIFLVYRSDPGNIGRYLRKDFMYKLIVRDLI